MTTLPPVAMGHMVERLVALLNIPSPTGDTHDALALIEGWLRELGLAPVFTRRAP